ncbi:MAG: C25 family cysteine peptidase [Planctomycetota bacterium]|jgi:gingipain R
MKRLIIPSRILIFLLVMTWASTALAHDSDDVVLDVQYTSLDRTILKLEINDFTRETITLDDRDYLQIGLEGEALAMMDKAGHPHLPVICRSLMIPDTARMAVSVLNKEYVDFHDVDLISYRGTILRTVDPATVPYTFGEVYQKDEWFTNSIATHREPYIMHDVRGMVVEIYPFQYNPVRKVLRFYEELEIEVIAVGKDSINIIDRTITPHKPDRAFSTLYKNHFINHQGNRIEPPLEDGEMLIISHGPFMSAMQPLIDWKTANGIDATIVDVASIGNDSTSIKEYITDIYNSSDLSYVLLVGDNDEVVSGIYEDGLSDAYYSTITADWYPDIFVGRFSANSLTHVDTQVERTVAYEQEGHHLFMGGWNTWGMGIASNQGAGFGHYGEADNEHMDLIRDELLAYGFKKTDRIYDPDATKAQITNGLNEGRRVVNYCGHGLQTLWGTTGFSNSDVDNLTNVGKLPFICSVACLNGDFGVPTCFGEAWLRATHNDEPAGAVACYMSSVITGWDTPMYGQGNHAMGGKYGAAERFWMEMNWSLAGCWYGGSCCMMDLTGIPGRKDFMNWILFGDPSLCLTTIPALKMSFPDDLPAGNYPPGPETVIAVKISAGNENYVPGTGCMHHRFDPDDPFTTTALTPMGGEYFEAVIPHTRPGDQPEFYFTAQGDGGTLISRPPDAPSEVYSFEVFLVQKMWEDDFETDQGWTVENIDVEDGAWEHAEPGASYTQPGFDHSTDGTLCYVTGSMGGFPDPQDLDGGPTRLISPVMDLSCGDGIMEFYLWFFHSPFGVFQPFEIHLSNDNGVTWVLAADDLPNNSQWTHYSYRLSDHITPTDQMRIRFTVIDNPDDDWVEGLVDDFTLTGFIYYPELWADAYSIPVSMGAEINFSLDAGPENAMRPYLLLGSLSGTSPGYTLPNTMVLPLNWDIFTELLLDWLFTPICQDFIGYLNIEGCATATFNTLGSIDPIVIGGNASFAYLLGPPPDFDFVSNYIEVTFDP